MLFCDQFILFFLFIYFIYFSVIQDYCYIFLFACYHKNEGLQFEMSQQNETIILNMALSNIYISAMEKVCKLEHF